MSEDASPTGGQRTPPNPEGATDQNSSIIEKVRSRVTSIIPFSKWFSPSTGASTSPSGEDGSRNGGIRRRREETVIQERTSEQVRQEGDDSEIEDAEDDEVDRAPPAKRSRLNVYEVHSPMGSFVSSHKNTANSFLSSTPTTYGVNRRKELNSKSVYQPLRNTVSSNTTKTTKSSTIVTRSITDFQSEQHDDDEGDTDILEVIPEHRDVNYIPEHWERSKISSGSSRNVGIRELRLPTRRPSLHGSRGNGPSGASSSTYSSKLANSIYRNRDEDEIPYEAQPDDEGGDEKKSDLLTNGIRGSPNMLSVDTASESGESQSSGVQKTNLSSGLYGNGAKRFRNSAVGGISYATHLQGKKSLFGDKNMPSHLNSSTTSLTSLNRRQSFNASLYGSTSALSDSRLLNIYSPFYKGCTTYGGASAYSKHSTNSRRVNPTTSFIRPSSSLSTTSSASHATESSAISNTAKRILELMNQFTTPLSDAKKMASNIKIPALTAHRQRFGDSDRIANRGIRMTFPKTPYSRPSKAQPNESEGQPGPPLNELQVPSMSQLLQMKKLHSSTEKAREITRMNQSKCLASIQPQNENKEYKLPPVHDVDNDGNSSSKHVNKIKNKLTSTRNSSKAVVEDTPVQPAALPDVRLPLKDSAVPKIDIDITKSTPKSISETKSNGSGISANTSEQANGKVTSGTAEGKSGVPAATKSLFTFVNQTVKSSTSNQFPNFANNNSNSLTQKPDILSNGGYAFVFQAPIQVTSITPLATKENAAPKSNFKFSEPVPVEGATKLSSPANNFVFQSSGSVTNKQTSTSTANSQNSSANVSKIPAAAPQLKATGSVLDVFKKPMAAEATSTIVSSSSSTAGFGAQFKMSNDKWECSVCLVRNENSADKCVSCTTSKSTADPAKPLAGTATKPLEPLKSSFGDKFKPTSDTWECPTCMIRNKIDLKQCEACNTAKPGATQSTGTPSLVSSSSSLVPNISSDSGFKSIVAEQTSKWECTACMTRNEPARTKCACCEQAKPGLVSENVPPFSFGSTASSSKFSFGFFNKKEEELKTENTSQKSATPTSGEAKQSVTFGTISTIPSTTSVATTSTLFSFGIKPATSTATATSTESVKKDDEPDRPSTPKFVFGSSSQTAKAETDKTAKTNELPATTTATSTPTFKFGAPATSTASSKFSLTPAKSVGETKSSSTSSTPSSSIFKPIGSMAFGASAEKKSDDAPKSVGFSFGSSTNVAATTGASTVVSKSSLSILGSGSQQKDQSSSADSSSTSTKLFTFGAGASPAATTIDKSKPATSDKPGEFSFGSPSSQSIGIVKSTTAQKTDTTTSTIASGTSTSSFVFGKPSNNASITPTFGAISSNVITSSNTSSSVSTAAPSFGTNTASSGTTTTASNFKPVVTQHFTSAPTFGSSGSAPKPSLFGTSTFGSASSSNLSTANKPASNLFQFGAGSNPAESAATTTAAAPIFGNVSSTTSARFSFGSNNATPAGTSNTNAPFVFGGASNTGKPSEPVTGSGLFGSAAATTQNNTTGPSLPGFGSFSSPIQTPQQQTLQPAQPSPFGQASTVSSPFGSNLSANPPAFGAASPAAPTGFGSTNTTFGASGTTAFASPAAKAPLFGNGFGSTASTTQTGDDPVSKKPSTGFNFGAASQSTTGGFSFNASNMTNNNNNNKQAFSFSTTSSPSFNFTGNPETSTNAPFQFSAAAPAANNMFAATPTPGSSQSSMMRRKARLATRRTQQR